MTGPKKETLVSDSEQNTTSGRFITLLLSSLDHPRNNTTSRSMDDYTNILSADFPARSASPPAAGQHQQHASHAGPSGTGTAAVDGGAVLDAHDHAMDFSFDSAQGDESFGPAQADAAQSLGTPGPRLTDEEKKARVRSSNRKAAEKSRNKKRREQ